MVVEMRNIKAILLLDDFAPVLPIAHLMDAIQDADSTVFSSVDIHYTFFSILINKGTNRGTTFYVDTGTKTSSGGNLTESRVFQRCAMGAQASSAGLCKTMPQALEGVSNIVVSYHDFFVYTRTRKEHLSSIDEMIGKLKRFILKYRLENANLC